MGLDRPVAYTLHRDCLGDEALFGVDEQVFADGDGATFAVWQDLHGNGTATLSTGGELVELTSYSGDRLK